MATKHIYLVPRGPRRQMKAAIELLREQYSVVKTALAPSWMGLLCETTEPVNSRDREALGLLVWE